MGAKVYVGGLPYQTAEQELTDLFSPPWGRRVSTNYHRQVYWPITGFWFCRNVQ